MIFLSFFSLTNLYAIEIGETIDYQRKITAHQWYWEYEYYLPKSLFNSVFLRWDYRAIRLLLLPLMEDSTVVRPRLEEKIVNIRESEVLKRDVSNLNRVDFANGGPECWKSSPAVKGFIFSRDFENKTADNMLEFG